MKQKKLSLNILVYITVFTLMTISAFAALTATPVNLGAAENYSVFSNVQIFSTGATTITGDIGVGNGVTSTAITGNFAKVIDATNDFATSVLVQSPGKVYAYDYTGGQGGSNGLTPAKITASTGALTTAYNTAQGQTNAVGPDLNIGAGTVIAQTLTPGVYTWDAGSGTTITITGDLTLDCGGDASKVFLFQFIGGAGLQLNAGKSILLAGQCQPGNIFWAVSGLTNVMAGAHMEGTVLGGPATTEIAMITGSTINGRLLGQKGIALDQNIIIIPVLNADSTPPVVSLVSPTNNTWSTTATPTFTFNYIDNASSTASCTLFANGVAKGTNSSVANNTNTAIIANASLSQGSNTWYVNCTDQANNVGNSSTRTVLVDSIYPTSLINDVNGVSNGFGTNSTTLIINFTANDTNLKNWTLSVYDSNWALLQSWTENTANISAVETYTAAANGTYYVNLTVRDNATSVNTTSFTVYVDQSAPMINNLSSSSIAGTTATITVNASDAYSGVNNCTYSGAGSGSLVLSGGLYTANLSGLTANTTYAVNIICYDKTGYSVNSTTNFTTTLGLVAAQLVNLGTAGDFVILTKSGISTTGVTSIVGDIGVSPAAATYLTGFSPELDASTQFAKSSLVTGNLYAADYSPSTPSKMTTAVSDMETAYTDAAGRAAGVTELGAGDIGGMTLAPGVYKWGTGLIIPTDVTLSGNSTAVWIFQIAQTLDISSGKKVLLSGGAQAKNIFWVVAGQTTLGTTSNFSGNILDYTAIVLNTGATLNGRALAQTAVTLDANSVSLPILVSLIPPTTIVINPGFTWNITDFNLTINATGFNGTNVSYINYTLNNTLTNVSISGNITGGSGTIFINESGNYTFVYYAVDTSNNIESSKTTYVLLDKIAPNITAPTLSTSGTIYLNDGVTASCTATDNIKGTWTVTVDLSTSSTGTKTATCTATDDAGNSVTSTEVTYTVHSRPSGGGSGGSSVVDNTQSASFSVMNQGLTNVEYTRAGVAIKNLEIKTTGKATDVKITITQLTAKPSGVPTPPIDKLYSYIQIDHTNLDNSIIEYAKIQFKVNKTWFTSKNVNVNEINLYRYTTQWDKLVTTMTSQDGAYYYFQANSPGLSYFAIGTAEVVATPTAPVITPITPTTPSTPTIEPGNNVNVPPVGNQVTGQVIGKTGYSPSWWMTALVLFVIIGLVIGGYFIFRKPNHSNKRHN